MASRSIRTAHNILRAVAAGAAAAAMGLCVRVIIVRRDIENYGRRGPAGTPPLYIALAWGGVVIAAMVIA